MAGKTGFEHRCEKDKVQKSEYKKSLKDSAFSHAQINMIWDFYVTHAISGGTGLTRTLENYGWENTNSATTGYGAVEKVLFSDKYFEKICFIRSNKCAHTLAAMDLANDRICVEHTRAVMLQNYHITVDENDTPTFDSNNPAESKLTAFFRHIRNAFAHANTYFFNNGMVLLEDKDKSKATASILIKQQTLLDWIKVIDKDENFYVLTDACASCKQEETNVQTNI